MLAANHSVYNPSACARPDDSMSPHDPSEHGPSAIGRLGTSTIAHRVHDLKNLLTIMAGCVDSLTGQLSELPALSDLADLQRTLSRAFLLATDLLGSDAALSHERSAININHAIVDIEGLLRRMLTPTIGFKLSLLAKAPLVVAHPLDIERILFNLILNAREAMGDQGLLTIETALNPIFTAAPPGPALKRAFVRLTVSDTGPGIPPGLQTPVVEPTIPTKHRVRGLGLSSVTETVQQLDGRVQIESQEGVGTRVHVDLPLTATRLQAEL
jgi:signal transduction histidine kinase